MAIANNQTFLKREILKGSYNNNATGDYQNGNNEIAQNNSRKYFNTMDSRNGLVISRIALPSDWKKETGGEYAFTARMALKFTMNAEGVICFQTTSKLIKCINKAACRFNFRKLLIK